jgi:hypothetical protein
VAVRNRKTLGKRGSEGGGGSDHLMMCKKAAPTSVMMRQKVENLEVEGVSV